MKTRTADAPRFKNPRAAHGFCRGPCSIAGVGSSVAIALAEAVESGRIQRGDLVLLIAFGAGLTWGAAVIEW